MIEYIEKTLEEGIHLQSELEPRANGQYQLDFSNSQTKTSITLILEKVKQEKRVTEYKIKDVLRVVGKNEQGIKRFQRVELPENTSLSKNLLYYREMNTFGTSGTLTF